MRARRESPGVGKVEVLCHQQSTFTFCGSKDAFIVHADQPLFSHGVNVMPSCGQLVRKFLREVFVQLELQPTVGVSGIGKSSATDAAANAIAART